MIRFDGVGMRYGSGPEILSDLNFEIKAGSFHFLTGPSGAGKTSLMRLMYLAQRQSRGLIHLFGQDLSTLPSGQRPDLRRRIGMVFQEFRLLPHLSAFDNVALPLRIAGTAEAQLRAQVTELLAWVGLAEHMAQTPPTLSGGQQQRVAIARAVIAKPDLLLADEPTGNVDENSARRLMRLFEALNDHGTTVIVATHNEALMTRFGHPVLRLERGRLSASPPPPSQRGAS
ncbi:MAG: cell division ATP-binding protein FtsE [Candidatus Symbiobacter sp.]|nr:cell division ATP-binding protein FtsE [Candidatus Symbiobacter sp.]